MGQMEPIIAFRNFSFKYRSQVEPTLKDINLEIYPGEKVLIVGPSGSGKSTLAHCMNGLVPFSYKGDITGDYQIKGQNPRKLGIFGLSKMVGTVLQDTDGQFIGLTVAEDIAFALENDRVEHQEMKQRVKEAAQMVDVKSLLHHSPRELSGGQKQRVAIARALAMEPEVLLFDEPTSALDPQMVGEVLEVMRKLAKEGLTMIIVTHEMAFARDVSTHVVYMANGVIVEEGTPADIFANPQREQTMEFLGRFMHEK